MDCKTKALSAVQLEEDEFDTYRDGTGEVISVRRFTWKNPSGISVQVITYGGTITSIKMPDKHGIVDDIILGYDNIEAYRDHTNPYFGASIGRVANRIALGTFSIDGQTYHVTINEGNHTLHGGKRGFNAVNWNPSVEGTKLTLSYLSKDNEEGFPGDVITTIAYELTDDNRFLLDYKATSDKATYVNLTNHSYFNLAGHATGAGEIYKHVVSINADQYTEVDEDQIPTGRILPVAGTAFDLRIPKALGEVINKIPVPSSTGFDHNFCVSKGTAQEQSFDARAVHPFSGRVLEVYSNQPGVQFYTGNGLPDSSNTATVPTGKGGVKYHKHGSVCFETQNYPDAINHTNFPPAVLRPGDLYHHTMELRFFVDQ